MTKPLVTVAIPCHNKAATVARTIEFVKVQTANNFECNIVLDRCTDNSLEIVKQAIGDDKRFVYYKVEFGNVADTRNYGISQGDAPFVCCIDADDWIEPEFLEVCLKPLMEDRSLGITFAGLMSHYNDGRKVQSPWPDGFNYDMQIQRRNQVPTCCVFRRTAWERTGGYRARYTGNGGAGSEDAAFWTAIGSIGFKAKQVTKKPLFNYSMEGGLVHDNKDYSEPDWLCFYPWVDDGKHPFASIATPKKWSHAVRQYDEPKVSVIIPVGPGHEKEVRNALDSLEMQHFRQWEAIVVWDNLPSPDDDIPIGWFDSQLKKSYPYVISTKTETLCNGAGYARNRGVEIARASLVLFLDADDTFSDPNALDKMLAAWNKERSIIYSDYLGKATWDYDEAVKTFGPVGSGRLVGWLQKTSQAVIRHNAADYDCQLAQRQPEFNQSNPNMPYFHWALVSCLVPKAWHDAIGGFDETMETWEDVDYHWRLARSGYCFSRIEEPLFLYNYDGGHRREVSRVKDEDTRQRHEKMIEYIRDKYAGIETVMCNCGKNKSSNEVYQNMTNSYGGMVMPLTGEPVKDDDMVRITFTPNYTGDRNVIGGATGIKYGYGRRPGEEFDVHILDIQANPNLFKQATTLAPHVEPVEQVKEALPEPALVGEAVDNFTGMPIEPPEPKYTQVSADVEMKMLDSVYKNYSAGDLVDLIKGSDMPSSELQQLKAWEEAKEKPRKTVIGAIEKALK